MPNENDSKSEDANQTNEEENKNDGLVPSFWQSLPDILKAVAAIIIAIGGLAGLITVLVQAEIIGVKATDTPTPSSTNLPSPTFTITPSPTFTPTPIPTFTITPSPTFTPTPSLTFTNIPSPSFTPTPSLTPEVATKLALCFRNLENNVIVREGPDRSTDIKGSGQISSDACLNFNMRRFDNSWVRIAEEQRTGEYDEFALGWVKFEFINPAEGGIENLAPYVPDDARDGFYCIVTLAGSKVRECPDTSDVLCPRIGTLGKHDCLYFDGRLEDRSWLRIAEGQGEEYTEFTHKWVKSSLVMIKEFLNFLEKPRLEEYLKLLPVVTPPPTPEG